MSRAEYKVQYFTFELSVCAVMTTFAVPIHQVDSSEQFHAQIYPSRRPAVLRGVPLGAAPSLWTPEYLSEKVGERLVKVHVSPVPQMDFVRKNFVYRTLPFNEFVRRSSEESHSEYFLNSEEKYYLRSLGNDPRKDVADIRSQFPELLEDIDLPIYCSSDQIFSSVLRIGSPGVQLWTHYDVMDNLLVQVTGRKRVVLFNPQDTNNLYLVGDKSRVLDIDNPNLSLFPRFARVTRHECLLGAGDVLFIPALWFHNVVSLNFSVAVNVFWKNLDVKLYDSRDTYGNKDPLPAQRAQQALDRGLKMLEELPDEYRDFYARRLVARIEEKSYVTEEK